MAPQGSASRCSWDGLLTAEGREYQIRTWRELVPLNLLKLFAGPCAQAHLSQPG
jgi:hypothetical protein